MMYSRIILVAHLAVISLVSPTSFAEENTSPPPAGELSNGSTALSQIEQDVASLQLSFRHQTQSIRDLNETLNLQKQIILDVNETVKHQSHTILSQNRSIENLKRDIADLKQSIRILESCDYGYKYKNETGSCYKWHGEEVEWTRANATCAEEGAHLAFINGRGEARLLGEILVASGWPFSVYVGYHRDDDNVWRTVTGETLEGAAGYSPWSKGQPDNDEHRIYAVMFRDGTLTNVDNEQSETFICEKKPQ